MITMKTIDTDRIPPEAFEKMRDKIENRPDPIDNTELVKDFRNSGGQLLHIRPRQLPISKRWTRGVTAAFVIKGGRFTLATAVVHTVDNFSKKNGTKTAIEHFQQGKTITLPLPKSRKPVLAIKAALAHLTT